MTINEFYSRIYKLFDEVTPLSKDCGVLCDGACCKDGDEKIKPRRFFSAISVIVLFVPSPAEFFLLCHIKKKAVL